MVVVSNFTEALGRIKHIAETLPDDDPDKVEMMNIEGDYSKLMEWALAKRNDIIIQSQGCDALISQYKARGERFNKKAANMGEICSIIMSAAGERKYAGSAGTVGFRAIPASVIITDESKIPKAYKVEKVTISVDKKALKEALGKGDVSGASLSNGGETIAFYK